MLGKPLQIPQDQQGNLPNQIDKTIRFNKAQLDFLEQQYPERMSTALMSNDEIRHYAAQRSVILFIKGRVSA